MVICKRIDTKTNQLVLPTTLFMILPVLQRENRDSTSFSSTPDPLFSWKWSSNVISEFEKFLYRTPQKNWSGCCLTIHPPLDLSWAADSFPRTIQIRPRRRLASTCFCILKKRSKRIEDSLPASNESDHPKDCSEKVHVNTKKLRSFDSKVVRTTDSFVAHYSFRVLDPGGQRCRLLWRREGDS